MRRKAFRSAFIVAAMSAATAVAAVPAAASTTVASWQMNEGSGATVMHDSSGNGIDGSIGGHIATGFTYAGATGYEWPYVKPNQPPADPERLATASDSRLNPGTSVFSVTVRFRTTHDFGNIIQKGQSGTAGGYWKWQLPKGQLTCLFRGVVNGSTVSKAVNSGTLLLNDGKWHTVTCTRTTTGVTMTIDGGTTRKATGWTGSISNSKALAIGGKLNCDQSTVTCDYFSGDIDYVTIATG